MLSLSSQLPQRKNDLDLPESGDLGELEGKELTTLLPSLMNPQGISAPSGLLLCRT